MRQYRDKSARQYHKGNPTHLLAEGQVVLCIFEEKIIVQVRTMKELNSNLSLNQLRICLASEGIYFTKLVKRRSDMLGKGLSSRPRKRVGCWEDIFVIF